MTTPETFGQDAVRYHVVILLSSIDTFRRTRDPLMAELRWMETALSLPCCQSWQDFDELM